jgi:exonuclease SbcC
MKLPAFLSKPRWQSKDPAKRRAAVAHDSDRELMGSLGRLAREDADAGVRIAAARRLADPGIVQGLAHDDADAGVRAQARALWLDLLTGTHPAAPPVAERLRLLKAQDDIELAERIACNASEPELRRAALAQVRRPALLMDRALADRDASIRLSLVERFDDESALERLAERARKSDKQVARRARDRIEELRLGRGDAATFEQRARHLCERMEQLLRVPDHVDAEREITIQWALITQPIAESLRARFQAATDLLARSRDPAPRVVPAVSGSPEPHETETAEVVVPAPAIDPDPAADPASTVVAPLIAQARFAVSLDEAQAARRQQQEQQRALLTELGEHLDACARALDEGASTRAHSSKVHIDALRRRIEAPLPKTLAQQLADVDARHAEVSRWQLWADRQRRQQLCEEIEALPELRLHPDAVATKVREAQAEWSRLDAIEGAAAARANDLGRRFHAACRAALAPAQGYFRKRHELRQSQSTAVGALLERAAKLAGDSSDWNAISELRRDTVEALRGLDRIEPRERKALAQSLKTQLAALDARITRRDADVERIKATLIAEAEALADGTPRGAVASARDLQKRWQAAGNGRRSRDQAQWNLFRAAVDRVFGKLDAERAERNARDTETRAQAESICTELEALAGESEPPERGASGRLQAAWDALRPRDEDLSRRFAEAQSRLRESAQRRERQLRHERFHSWLNDYRMRRTAESSHTPEQPQQPLPDDVFADARSVMVELEMLAGVESPVADLDLRRNLQIERLSTRMRGAQSAGVTDQLDAMLARWTSIGATPAEMDARFERALLAAIESLP